MTDPHFSHDRNGNCLDDLFDHLGVALEKGKYAKNTHDKIFFFSIRMHTVTEDLALAIRATPPVARISAGTRSSAMTAHAPASSAIRA
jgi:hypothetical protein